MDEQYGFFWNSHGGDRKYNAESMSNWLKRFFTTGVFTGDLFVEAIGGMHISVGTGYANINGKVLMLSSETEFILDTSYDTLNRVDTVVVERNDEQRSIHLKVITGGTDGLPIAPIRTDSVYQLVLAQIAVSNNVIEISQADITDTREDPNLCGIVTGTVEEIDFSQIIAQWDTYYTNFKTDQMADFRRWTAAQKAAWVAWAAQETANFEQWSDDQKQAFADLYDDLVNLLDGAAAARLQIQIDALKENHCFFIENGMVYQEFEE